MPAGPRRLRLSAGGIGTVPDVRRGAAGEAPAMPIEDMPAPTVGRQGRFRVVIAGGGVAALGAALALRALAEEQVAIQLGAPEPQFWYRPLSVLEPFRGGHLHQLELAELCRACGAGFDPGALASVDDDAKVARTAAGAEYPYDALVLACGAQPRQALAGALAFRGPADSDAFARLVKELESDLPSRLVFVVPGGIRGRVAFRSGESAWERRSRAKRYRLKKIASKKNA